MRKAAEEEDGMGFDFSRKIAKKKLGSNGKNSGAKHKLGALGGGAIRLSLSKSLNSDALNAKFKESSSVASGSSELGVDHDLPKNLQQQSRDVDDDKDGNSAKRRKT